MKYQEIPARSRAEIEADLERGPAPEVIEALLSAALHDPDWRWVQAHCLRFARHEDPGVRGVAATCLGHLARLHRQLDLDAVVPVLEALRRDPQVVGPAEDALDDIETFIGKHR